jgi:hypothetical protein
LYRRFMQTTVPPELPQHLVDSFWQLNAPEPLHAVAKGEKPKNDPNGRRPNALSHHQKPLGRRLG